MPEVYDWKVTAGMDRVTFEKAFAKEFPKAENPPDFQTSLSYGAGVLLGLFIEKANSLDGAALKQAALDLSGNVTVMTGPYEIDETGNQLLMPFIVTQVQKNGDKQKLVLLYPEEVATGEVVFPIPAWKDR